MAHKPDAGRIPAQSNHTQRTAALVVAAARQHLLASGVQVDGVLVLRHVGALDIAERRVRVHDAHIAQVLERHLVLALTEPVEVAAGRTRQSAPWAGQAQGGRARARPHRLQKASVPKFLSIVASSALARGSRSGRLPASKFFM